ncbi:MAG TPA: GAF domain-containing protein [Bacilli bacterium]|jgi:L-methionine (R)-S-oxide reductase|nr:MAG: Free methionine-R-sulfoxide reductase [Tenericutes bacterium ADurb.Bin140]HOE78289.1 GAF domain-containing protein [Bacilli bacterium]HON64065.1 GAF domain-containing protein [Bacilli bacterium]HOR96547.1 GAF domain-containing protein [Bacilli bacterium]HPD12924.1 GAF domain-containing protein [Bacilli bacterium]
MNKEQTYQELLTVMPVVLADTAYEISLLANFVALIHQMLPDVSWTGIYLNKEEILILGPFQGKVACTVIPFNRGVCGASATERRTIVVPNVHRFSGHIACDEGTMSEIVVPLIINGELFGVLDLDSYSENRFDETDQKYLEKSADILISYLQKLNQ